MNASRLILTTSFASLVSCAAHHPPTALPKCVPLSPPLSVAKGDVVITCSVPPDQITFPFPHFLECVVRPSVTAAPVKSAQFGLPQLEELNSFDPNDQNNYESWDGCFTIGLRDGRVLEEFTVITSYAASHARGKGNP